jgi:hypothetical protein
MISWYFVALLPNLSTRLTLHTKPCSAFFNAFSVMLVDARVAGSGGFVRVIPDIGMQVILDPAGLILRPDP